MNTRDTFSVKDRVIILTGGAGFLGKNYAKALYSAGAEVILWDKYNTKSLHEALKDLPQEIIDNAQSVDVSDERAVQDAVERVVRKHKKIDVLINNAAMNPAVGSEESKKLFVPYDEYPIDLFRKEIDVNLVGPMICTKAVVPFMKKRKSGTIINISSEVSNIAHDHRVYSDLSNRKYKSPAYVASKTAIVGLTRQWAAYLGQFGIRIIAFSPGGVRNNAMTDDFVERFGKTNMFGRMAYPEEYNGIIQFLCSDAASFITGFNLTADGGKGSW